MNPELRMIIKTLKEGGLVAWPTDTTWGLLAAADNTLTLERIYELKGRPRQKPLQLLISELPVAEKLTDIRRAGPQWFLLAKRFWPGGLTLVAPASAAAPTDLVYKGKLGLRLPADTELREVISALGGRLAATSLNRSGEEPVGSFEEAVRLAGWVDYIRAGAAPGVASSVYELPEGRLLRAGAVSSDEIASALEETWTEN